MDVIGLGVGRTGTYSLKLALNELGLGPCHHMEEVLMNQATQVPLWAAAADGRPDWRAIYEGYRSAVDWPTAGFHRELAAAFPSARFIITVRDSESWADSFMATIQRLGADPSRVRDEMQPWTEMAFRVIEKTGFSPSLDRTALVRAFDAHTAAVRAAIPSERLLVYQVKDGWAPLCSYLGLPVPAAPFPRTNDRGEFWQKVAPALK